MSTLRCTRPLGDATGAAATTRALVTSVARDHYALSRPLSQRTRGFTLIEMLMVIVTIGILVTVLIPRWAAARDKASVAAMTSDLRNLATAQESYFDDHATYAATTSALPLYSPSSATRVTIDEASGAGWSGTASSTWTLRQCYVFYGNALPLGPAREEGVIACN